MIDRALTIHVGQSFSLPLRAVDEARTVESLAGYLVRGTIKTDVGGTLLTTFEGYVTDADKALAVAFLTPTKTQACEGYVSGHHYVEAYLADESEVIPLSRGPVTFMTRDAT